MTLADIDLPGADLRRRDRRDRAGAGGARDPPRRAARRGLRGRAARRALRPGRRLDGDRRRPGRRSPAGSRWRGRRRARAARGRRADRGRARAPAARPGTARRARRTAVELAASVGVGLARSIARRRRAARLGRCAGSLGEAAGQLPRLDASRAACGPAHADLARAAARRAGRARPRRRRSSCSRTAPTPTARSRGAIDNVVRGLLVARRPPGRARRRADGHPAERARGRRGAQPAGRGRRADAARRRPSPARPSSAQVERIVADPEHGEPAARRGERPGARARRRRRGRASSAPGVIDMERIDPDEVELPAWYEPNPGRAGDLAFVLFTGEGERTPANRITNGRWALSAFGTASSAALDAERHRLQRHARSTTRRRC